METQQVLDRLAKLIRQPELKVRVEHENLETVYLEATAEGEILVHDRRSHAHTYLSTGGDQTGTGPSSVLNTSASTVIGSSCHSRIYSVMMPSRGTVFAAVLNRISRSPNWSIVLLFAKMTYSDPLIAIQTENDCGEPSRAPERGLRAF